MSSVARLSHSDPVGVLSLVPSPPPEAPRPRPKRIHLPTLTVLLSMAILVSATVAGSGRPVVTCACVRECVRPLSILGLDVESVLWLGVFRHRRLGPDRSPEGRRGVPTFTVPVRVDVSVLLLVFSQRVIDAHDAVREKINERYLVEKVRRATGSRVQENNRGKMFVHRVVSTPRSCVSVSVSLHTPAH